MKATTVTAQALKRMIKTQLMNTPANGANHQYHHRPRMMAMHRADSELLIDKALTTIKEHLQRCLNPFCEGGIDPVAERWRRTERRSCSDRCRMDGFILRRARSLYHKDAELFMETLEGALSKRTKVG
jgi:hypothetical protein